MHARIWIFSVVAFLLATHAWARVEFSNAQLDLQAGPAVMESGEDYGIAGQFQFGLNETNNLRHDRVYQLFHVRFLHADAYQTTTPYQYGLTGILAGASFDISGNLRRGEFGVMPSVLAGGYQVRRKVRDDYWQQPHPLAIEFEPKDGGGFAGALLGGLRLQGLLLPRTSIRVEVYAGVIKDKALLAEAAVDVQLYRGLSAIAGGQFCDVKAKSYTLNDSSALGNSVFSADGWKGWGFIFGGLHYSF